MLFVTVTQNPDSPVKQNSTVLEDACKNAWEAMANHSDSGPFEADEVGGLMAFDSNDGKPGSCVLRFYYPERPNRGLAFRDALLAELRIRVPEDIDVIPVSTRRLFKDPVWAVKPRLKLLFICTANVSRSRTAEDLLKNSKYYEVQSAGIRQHELGGQLVTQELADWADRIFVMDENNDRHLSYLRKNLKVFGKDIYVLNIPDIYRRGDNVLVDLLKTKLNQYGVTV